MRTRSIVVSATLTSLVALGCGGNVVAEHGGAGGAGATTSTTTSTSTSTSTTTTTSTSSTTALPGGDCETDGDCQGGACVPLTPGGWRACAHPPAQAAACHEPAPPMPDQCCTTADCKDGGACFASTTLPACGGMPVPEMNECMKDQCASDADCTGPIGGPGVCLPVGAYGLPTRWCFSAACRTNADCTAAPGGECRPIENPCCGFPSGLACVYPGGCSKQADCGPNAHCAIDAATKSATCQPGDVGCPA